MSSYQFMNSLNAWNGAGRAGPVDGSVPTGAPGDYSHYSQQMYNNWSQANNQASNVAAAAAAAAASLGQSPASPSYSAYLQQNGGGVDQHHLNHHRDLYSNAANCGQQALINQSAAAAAAAARLSQHHNAQQLMQQPSVRSSGSPNSCKYEIGASSPQDLSTSSGAGQSPEPGRSSSPPTNRASNQTTSSQQSSNSSSNQKGAPHIYPWMRKVHVGQSKFSLPLFHHHKFFSVCFNFMQFLITKLTSDGSARNVVLSYGRIFV